MEEIIKGIKGRGGYNYDTEGAVFRCTQTPPCYTVYGFQQYQKVNSQQYSLSPTIYVNSCHSSSIPQ